MKSEIRVWDHDVKKYFYSQRHAYFEIDGYDCEGSITYFCSLYGICYSYYESPAYQKLTKLKNSDYDLFTGIFDAKGRKIFDQDILQHPMGDLFIVRWSAFKAGFIAYYSDLESLTLSLQVNDRGQAVIVGNKRENIDLVEKLNEQNAI